MEEKQVFPNLKNGDIYISLSLLNILSSKIQSSLMKRDLKKYEPAIRANIKKDFVFPADEDLDGNIKEDILEMDEWLFSADVDESVWQVVLDKTKE